uniref:Uncharacterized protein n=1 Tax=Pipistrellus kuhlii TaxID=59472 RepID=A0A7J7RG32_PIPKU|nr:hypothetical protein mPipKuh1_010558 [Pipistrellus kuhlii]
MLTPAHSGLQDAASLPLCAAGGTRAQLGFHTCPRREHCPSAQGAETTAELHAAVSSPRKALRLGQKERKQRSETSEQLGTKGQRPGSLSPGGLRLRPGDEKTGRRSQAPPGHWLCQPAPTVGKLRQQEDGSGPRWFGSMDRRVPGSIPVKGTRPGCRLGPQCGACKRELIHDSLIIDVSLSPFLSGILIKVFF